MRIEHALVLFMIGRTGAVVQEVVQKYLPTGPFVDLFKHTTFDAFLVAALSIGLALDQKKQDMKTILLCGLIGASFGAFAESAQGVLQNILQVIPSGFAWIDYAAYTVGGVMLAPIILLGATKIHSLRRRIELQA